METAKGFANIATGIFGFLLIVMPIAITSSDFNAAERVGYFITGGLLLTLCIYVFHVESLTDPNGWQNAAKASSIVIGILFVLLIIFLTWFVIQLLKAVTQAVGNTLGGG